VNLQDKGQRWLDMTLKSVTIFAVLGLLVLLVAVHFVEKMFKDVLDSATGTSAPAKTSTDAAKAKH